MSSTMNGAKPRLSIAQIINMSVGFFGIQFALGLQNANVSRIFQTLGAEIDEIPILWIAAPLTGLVVQPIIGYISDKTWMGKLGRRRPFFLAGAIFASLALVIFPGVNVLWMAAVMLWLLDASINVSMEPFRAFVGDLLPDEQRTMGFAMQSFFIGFGAVISSCLPYLLTYLGISNDAPPGVIPDSVRFSFLIGAGVYMSTIIYTVLTTKEYSPEELKALGISEYFDGPNEIKTLAKKFLNKGIIWLIIGLILSASLYFYNLNAEYKLKKELYVFTGGITAFGLIQLIAFIFYRAKRFRGFVEVIDDLNFLPTTMKRLAVVQFFSWFALFSMWIYTTPALAQHIAGTTDASSPEYNRISNWVGFLFGCYNGFSALFAFLLPVIAKQLTRSRAHMISLIAGGLGLISFYFFKNEYMLILSMAGVGIAWCSILSMPYSILTQTLPSNKMGVYMGIFNFFIVIPQILAATLLGLMIEFLFDGQAIYTLVFGGCSMIVAAFLTLRIKEKSL